MWDELNIYQNENVSKSILLDLLKMKSLDSKELIQNKNHVDDELLYLSIKFDWPVLTVDKKLKERLHDSNCKVIQVSGGKKIELIS